MSTPNTPCTNERRCIVSSISPCVSMSISSSTTPLDAPRPTEADERLSMGDSGSPGKSYGTSWP
eukprot:jgi/Chrpa1/975/Chrysochromulina_OHIO_Genome00000684-RA